MGATPIDWRELFASAQGRVSRGRFWFAAGALLILAAVYEIVVGPTLKLLTFWLIYPILIASAVCVVAKRLHDRGRSGWWAALVLCVMVMIWPTPHGVRAVLAAPALLWSFVELCLMSGEQGTNRFGPSPLATTAV